MSEPWEDLKAQLAQRLEGAGFDIFGAATVGAYNQTLDENFQGYRLPEPSGEDSLVLVIGNTRRLWPMFLRAYAAAPLSSDAHPLDAYTRSELARAVDEVADAFKVESALRYTFDPLPRAVAAQRLTVLTGAAEASPVGLLIHPSYGPWFSLRAAAVFGVAGPKVSAPPAICSVCVDKPCIQALERVKAATGGIFNRETFEAHWKLWLAMREACPVGEGARFSEQQIRYHYLKNVSILQESQG